MQSIIDYHRPDLGVDHITRLAEKHGWPPRQAFELAMVLTVEGVSVSEAEWMFERETRWRQ